MENKNPIVTIEMENGKEIKIELYPNIAPNTVKNFVSLVNEGYYNGIIFHRVIPGFMIQGGCPNGTGMGGPGHSIKGEFSGNGFTNNLKHERGVISMARTMAPNSAGSQFFIMHKNSPHLDGQYAGFGRVIEGMDTVDEIASVRTDSADKPQTPQVMKSVTVETFGIDYSDVVIEASKNMAKNLGYKNMSFIKEDLTNYTPNRDVDLVISLHACDTATDMAIGLGIRAKSEAIVVVPCCHKELLGQYRYEAMEPILKHGVFKARFADLITDGLRTLLLEGNGYDTSVVEYISPLDTPKNLMIRAIKTKTNNDKALKEYKELKSQFGVEPTLEKLIY